MPTRTRTVGSSGVLLIPLIVNIAAPTVNDDLVRVRMPKISGVPEYELCCVNPTIAVRAFTAGTATFNLKRDDGTVLCTKDITAAGDYDIDEARVETIAAEDFLRFGFSAIGTGLVGVTIVLWVAMPTVEVG